ncbi:MAG TPA: DUF6159 family protein [Acidimicrobiia bacterium]|nr:DUF6159 family protein [Acidimicrobiia bacterium]
MQRIRNSWELAKVSWSVLRSDKSLAVFPLLSALAGLAVVGIVAGLIAATGVNSANGGSLKGIGYVFIAAGYIASAFVTTYFLGALVHGANEALEGRHAELGECFGAANNRLHRILPWALVQATVSIVIQALESQRLIGQIVASLIGTAWAVLTFLTVPIIMLEDLGPIVAVKRSGQLLRRSWGENLTAQVGFGIFGFVALLPAALLVAIGAATGSLVVVIALATVAVAWAVVTILAVSALSGIYRTALYRFAVDGVAPPAFAGADLQHALGPRQNRPGLGFGG